MWLNQQCQWIGLKWETRKFWNMKLLMRKIWKSSCMQLTKNINNIHEYNNIMINWEKLFHKGRFIDVEHKRCFMSKLMLDIWKLCVVKSYAKMEELLVVAIKVDWAFGEIGEIWEEHEERSLGKIIVKKQVKSFLHNGVYWWPTNKGRWCAMQHDFHCGGH